MSDFTESGSYVRCKAFLEGWDAALRCLAETLSWVPDHQVVGIIRARQRRMGIPERHPRLLPHADGECQACGNPTLMRNVRDALGELTMPDLPEGAVACVMEGCPSRDRVVP